MVIRACWMQPSRQAGKFSILHLTGNFQAFGKRYDDSVSYKCPN